MYYEIRIDVAISVVVERYIDTTQHKILTQNFNFISKLKGQSYLLNFKYIKGLVNDVVLSLDMIDKIGPA